jgi:hypothetical protein
MTSSAELPQQPAVDEFNLNGDRLEKMYSKSK